MQEEARQDEQCHTSLRRGPGLRFPQSGVADGFHDSHPRRVSGFPISAESLKSADTTQRLVWAKKSKYTVPISLLVG